MKIWKNAVLFYLGGCIYMALELLFRGRTHGSMFLAGGACFLLLGLLGRARPRLPGPLLPIAGALIVTAVELAVGLAVNRDWTVWDYRGQWGISAGRSAPCSRCSGFLFRFSPWGCTNFWNPGWIWGCLLFHGIAPQAFPSVTTPVCAPARNDAY